MPAGERGGPGPGAGEEADTASGDLRRPVGRDLRSALGERLPLWFRLRCGLAPKTLAALAVVLVAAAVFAGRHFWAGRPETVSAPELTRPAVAEAELPDPLKPSPPGSAPAAGAGARIVVDVGGKVRRPGVLRLPAGSRVADALEAAGGVRSGADLTGLNRARVLVDGEQVVVGLPASAATDALPGQAQAPGTGGGGAAGRTPGPLSLNAATAEQLEALPGVGPVLAQHILDYRTRQNGFRSVDQLREVDGIGDRRFADLRPLVRP